MTTWNKEWRNHIVSFDVESLGLYGEGFAVGAVVIKDDVEIDSFYARAEHLPRNLVSDEDWSWLERNVFHLLVPPTHKLKHEAQEAFWEWWTPHREAGAVLVADCPYPVEARWLMECVGNNNEARKWQGPYPLIDVASVLAALGRDPLATYSRLPNEEPAHHPLMDARQSARVMLLALHNTLSFGVAS